MSEPLDPEEVLRTHVQCLTPGHVECTDCQGAYPWPCPAVQLARQLQAAQERVAAAYTLLISATPALYRAWDKAPNLTAMQYAALLHDKTVDWLDEYRAATGRADDGLARIVPGAALSATETPG